ncbi:MULTISPECIES: hypothetical protein [Sanguibacter]|uniref:Toxin n=1 Tax=Sanguibacter inulinus TaxID=60922 RepID=A0A853ERC0_9MICO|nr:MULTISPECIES: hypothetical protein [Sanguibacter]KQT96734.1 hypothetical protein ASG53_16935 [Sanguibacter sp. Leaf3]MBF0721991.1 hypothetical protein [Sanguibacter inulinus]NYS93136.1 hypothetical protein [Sanguibacter inulinus]
MAMTWADSAGEHDIPQDEALYAMLYAHALYDDFEDPRPGHDTSPRLYIGPSRFGTLEVMVNITPPGDVRVFHVMRLRETTRTTVGYEEKL